MRINPRRLRFAFQRLFRGWDDSETWSLDVPLAKNIAPRLRRFKELNNGIPCGETEVSWDIKLDAMIWAFEFAASEERWGCPSKEQWEKAQKGLGLFAKHYFSLWW